MTWKRISQSNRIVYHFYHEEGKHDTFCIPGSSDSWDNCLARSLELKAAHEDDRHEDCVPGRFSSWDDCFEKRKINILSHQNGDHEYCVAPRYDIDPNDRRPINQWNNCILRHWLALDPEDES